MEQHNLYQFLLNVGCVNHQKLSIKILNLKHEFQKVVIILKQLFLKKGDYDPQTGERGNLLLQLVPPSPQQRKYTKYTRNGNDLMLELDITLKQSLIGFNIDIPHFGKIVRIASDKSNLSRFYKMYKRKRYAYCK